MAKLSDEINVRDDPNAAWRTVSLDRRVEKVLISRCDYLHTAIDRGCNHNVVVRVGGHNGNNVRRQDNVRQREHHADEIIDVLSRDSVPLLNVRIEEDAMHVGENGRRRNERVWNSGAQFEHLPGEASHV